MTLHMEKLKFEQDIVDVLVKHDLVSKGAFIEHATITIGVDILPIITVKLQKEE